ncbi:probable RNA-binding protein 46 [Chelonus insularis]|uniref:probable RNA-binding protein 46 n=1 Tax=Chelonus insularis TaxID=460826 RepID=UPI00158EAE3D|nr:probable RNA-binding protein 46 [Chelonus insularis]
MNNQEQIDTDTEATAQGQCRISVRLLNLMEKTHYELVQENGQRRLTSPELTKERRERIKGAEVFLGRLPRDCYEDELMPVLEKVGHLLELRLMLDFSGSTRGYAFALYEDAVTAKKACQLLDGYQLRPGHKIGVVKSIDNCRLFFGGVPKDKTKAEFTEELGKILDGISDIYLYPNAQDHTQNRGFIFVEFKDHRSAAMARRKLIPGRVVLWNHEIAVDWADPEPGDPIDDEVMATVTALFVRNLPLDLPHQKIRDTFHKATGIPILKLKKINHFAFVHYETRELAEKVINIMNAPGGIAEQRNWEIRWAKPIGAAKVEERQRSINEAIAASKMGELQKKKNPSTSNRRIRKKGSNHEPQSPNHQVMLSPDLNLSPVNRAIIPPPISPPQHNIQPPLQPYNYQRILEDFVSEKLCAKCQINCHQLYSPTAYVCKITIFREDHIIYDYTGNIFFSEELAINVTSRDVYFKLTNSVAEQQMIPIYVYPQTAQLQSRMEACH